MKIFKRLTAMTLAMVMIVTMLSLGLTSQASIVQSKENVTVSIVVPETIYLTPGGNTFQYYIAGAANGSTPSSNKSTTGAISFSCSKAAKSISVSVEGASDCTYDVPTVSSTQLTSTIRSGSMASAASGLLTWTFTYVIPHTHNGVTTDLTYTSKAYTYVYAPFLSQTGCMHSFTYKTTIGNEPKLCVYAFLMGIHSTNGGPYRSAFTGTSGLTMSPLVPGWSDSNVPAAEKDDDCNLPDADTYFPASGTGGVTHMMTGRDRDGSTGGHDYGSTNGYGVLTVDKSRYSGSAYNAIPNFAVGWMMFGSTKSSVTHEMSDFSATGNNSTLNFAANIDYANDATSKAYGPYTSSAQIPLVSTNYSVTATYRMRRSSSSTVTMTDTFGFHLVIVDKGTLRDTINNAISAAYQADDFSSADFNAFSSALQAAATVLGKPDATEAEITNANGTLAGAVETLTTQGGTIYTATVTHKLPAADGFKYLYNGVEYTAANGYISITETQTFPSASDVTVSANTDFTGYTISGSTSESYSKRRSDINKTFTYTAQTSKIYFDYVDAHIIGGLDGVETERTVTYGQPYGTLPAPAMDGWVFGGWYESGTSNRILGTTNCTMINGTLYLQAKWTCNFSGGYGTASEPFLIASMANLDKIDDATAYQINNGNSGTKGKYYKQTADFNFSANSAPVLDFGGTYEGDGKKITIPSSITVSSTAYGCIFGAVSGAVIRDINVTVQGGFAYTGTSGNSGFVGTLTNSTLDNVHITFAGTTKGANSGILVNTASGSTITNCSVDVQSGTVPGDAFIGSVTGGTRTNNWVLLTQAMDGTKSNTANGTIRVRENATAAVTYANGRYIFTATPNTGWSAQFRTADDTLVIDGATYSPAVTETGKVYYVCAVKDVTFQAGAHGTLTGAGTYKMRQHEVKTGLTPVPATGYQFSAWSFGNSNGTMSDSSPYSYTMNSVGGTITANFGANHYSVVFNKGNVPGSPAMPAQQNYSFEDKVTFPSSSLPTYPGWTCTPGWYSEAPDENGPRGTKYELNTQYDALASEDGATVTVYAYWTQNVYTVSFATNGGTEISPVTMTYGETLTFPNTTKIGYKDLLWYTDSGFTSGGYQAGTGTQIYDNITFYAKWTPISYTIRFNAPGAGNVPSAQLVNYDSGEFIIPSTYAPVMAGYDFRGWDTVTDGSGTRYNVTDSIPGNLSATDGFVYNLYAQWDRAHYNVTWVLGSVVVSGETKLGKIDGSTANPVTEVVFGDRYIVPKGDITLETKQFRGWYTAPTGGTPVTDLTTVTITDHTSFYAQWDPAVYTVKYYGNGGTGVIPDVNVVYGQLTFTFADNAFTRDGYSFTGWNTVAHPTDENPGIAYQPGMGLTDDLTTNHGDVIEFYAQWKGNTFKIAYDVGGIGTTLMTTNNVVMDGSAVNLRTRTTATKEGATYVFKGWAYTAADEQNLIKAYDSGASFSLTEAVLAKSDYNLNNNTITLYAIWARENTVTWDLMGGKMTDGTTGSFTTQVTRGDKYVLPSENPKRARYVFTGWFTTVGPNDGIMITNDTVLNANADQTVYARWVSNGNLTATYTTQYYYEGYTADDYSATPTVVTGQGDIEAEVDITATVSGNVPAGFTLDTAKSVLTGVITEDQGEDANPLVLKVYYKRNHYTVSFNANGGTGTMASVDYAYDQTKALPANTTINREGYTFLGWNTSADATTARYGNGADLKMELGNVDLYAVWQINQYTLTINNGYGGTISSQRYDFGAAITQPASPERTGYTFKGWSQTIPATMPAGDLTIEATWQIKQFTLTINNGYGGTISSANYDYDTAITAPADPTRTGYTFTGWSPAVPAKMPANDLTITATWSKNQYTLTFANGYGGNVSSGKVDFDAAITAPADPTRTGYTFAGWLPAVPAKMPANDLTITATWTVKQYTLTFANGYGANISSESVDYDAAITEPADPTRTGYTFKGWTPAVPAKMPANDLTITATWTVNQYLLTFSNGYGENLFSESVDFGSTITAPTVPERTGYTYKGWDKEVPETMPANNLTITATWEVNSYRLTITDGFGSNIVSEDINYGAPIPAQTNPTKTGYTFTGWSAEIPETMPARNVTINATWTAHRYTVVFAANGGTGTMESLTLTYDVPQALPELGFSKTGFSFAGWSVPGQDTLIADKGEVVNLASANGASVTLTAEWDNVIYTISFDLNGGTAETAPADISTILGNEETLCDGADYTFETASERRFFLGWLWNGTLYAGGSTFTMPAQNVTFTAVWSANYLALDNLVALVEGYQQANAMPASGTADPRYASGGDFAALLESNGIYPWSSYDTASLTTAVANAKDSSNRNLPQSEQQTVDALTAALQSAVDNVTLLDVDYNLTYKCNHNKKSYYDSSSRKYYPACESGTKHSYNSVIALIDALLAASDADSLYTASSIAQLRTAIYGSSGSTGIAQEVQAIALKLPAQSLLATYVDQIAEAYHSIPVVKDADYSQITYLMTTYLQQQKQVTTETMQTYYTTQSCQALMQYYNDIDRTYKITRQSVLNEGGRIYNELKGYIDALVPRPADYSSVYEQILHIPCGESFSYPSGSINDTETWKAWTSANAGHISQAIDATYLDTRYEPNTVAILNDVLDGINWNLNIFSQDAVNGMTEDGKYKDGTIAKTLASAIAGLVKRTYSVTYMMNDGTAVAFTTQNGYYYGNAIQLPTGNPSRDGYVFLGWSTSASEYIAVTSSTAVTGNTTLYAAWERNVAMISFDLNGGDGTAPDAIEADVGQQVALPAGDAFAPEGYKFLGWAADPAATTGAMTYTLAAKADVTLYAIWGALSVAVVPQDESTTVIDEANGYIYGLALNVTEPDLLANYLKVEGNGTLRVQQAVFVGTGLKVELINNYTNEVDATYHIVLFGDTTGDGMVDQSDIAVLKAHMTGADELPAGDPRLLAGDVDGDGVITQMDTAILKGMMNGAIELDQATRSY